MSFNLLADARAAAAHLARARRRFGRSGFGGARRARAADDGAGDSTFIEGWGQTRAPKFRRKAGSRAPYEIEESEPTR